MRARVQAARSIQQTRFTNNGSSSDIVCNANIGVGEIRQFCKLPDEGGVLSVSKHQSMMRWRHRAVHDAAQFISACLCIALCHHILKLARTIADLAGCEEIQSVHLAEALHAIPSEVDVELI